MEEEALRNLIKCKLESGLLPYNSIPRIWGAPGTGETCDACDRAVEQHEMVMEGISLADGVEARHVSDRRRPLQLHVRCFYFWDAERRS
jgi:hypothetical protein